MLDSKVEDLNTKIRKSLDIACPKRKVKITGKPRNWFTKDLEELQKIVRRHHRAHLNKISEQNFLYECEICEKSYNIKSSLVSHMKTRQE